MSAEMVASSVWWGWSPAVVSMSVFVLTYGCIVMEKFNRAVVALLGAGLMVLMGVLHQTEAFAALDLNTIGLLTGMMVIVSIMQETGVFQYMAIWSAQRVQADPWGVMLMQAVITALFSALLDNVTTVLLMTPIVLLLARELQQNATPYLLSMIFASNIGGAATLIGDPPNIMIGSAARLGFNDFLWHVGPAAALVFALLLLVLYGLWGRKLHASPAARATVMAMNARAAISDVRLLKQSSAVLGLVMLGFGLAGSLHLEPATLAMFGAALLLLLRTHGLSSESQSHYVDRVFGQVEWVTIFFFIGLFVVVAGVEKTGWLSLLAHEILALTAGDPLASTMAILWVSAIASALVDNIPFVATMIPVVQDMLPSLDAQQGTTLWWALSLGACLGGNGSLMGASANLVVAGFAERAGQPLRFVPFLLLAFPLMLASIAVSAGYLWWRYF